MIKILIADDHPIIRKGLIQILQWEGEYQTSEVESGEKVLEKLFEEQFDLLLLDINLPGINGLEVLKTVKQSNPTLAVLVLSIHPEDQYAIRALKGGVSGYLCKESAPEELVKAIKKILEGGRYISNKLADQLADNLFESKTFQLHEDLSDRELDVMCRIAKGHSLTKIAEDMVLSIKTISTYRARILEKMHFDNNAEMTAYSIKNNLISFV
jgi:two-component system, NarL family, invasion response regulator UvrY